MNSTLLNNRICAKPWIYDYLQFESNNSKSNYLRDISRLVVLYPKEEISYYFPGVDDFIRPISDGEIKMFALFHPAMLALTFPKDSSNTAIIEVTKYHLKALDVEIDRKHGDLSADLALVVMIVGFTVKYHNVNVELKDTWVTHSDKCQSITKVIIKKIMEKRNKVVAMYHFYDEEIQPKRKLTNHELAITHISKYLNHSPATYEPSATSKKDDYENNCHFEEIDLEIAEKRKNSEDQNSNSESSDEPEISLEVALNVIKRSFRTTSTSTRIMKTCMKRRKLHAT